MLIATGADTYLWNTGELNASILITTTGTYTVTGTNGCGQDVASITVLPAPPPVAQITGELLICTGSSTTLTASPATSYLWSTQQTTQSIAVNAPGVYTVTLSNGCGSATTQVEVENVALDPAFTATPTTGPAPLPVAFTNTSSPPNATWSWAFGDGGASTASGPFHTYTGPGTYIATLTMTVGACTDEVSLTIAVEEADITPPVIVVPNVFSPNADGVNDQLVVISSGIAAFRMDIFNRWGQRVAGSDRVDQRWDARDLAGAAVVDGTYFYVYEAQANTGAVLRGSGAITVLR